jgi:hypothetical protein
MKRRPQVLLMAFVERFELTSLRDGYRFLIM